MIRKPKICVRKKAVEKTCAICGRVVRVIIYTDRSYRGGHFFGKIPLYTKREMRRVARGGTTPEKMGKLTVNVCNIDPKPYQHIEYWECPRCYRG